MSATCLEQHCKYTIFSKIIPCELIFFCKNRYFQPQFICQFSNERTCTRKKDVEGLSCGFEVV